MGPGFPGPGRGDSTSFSQLGGAPRKGPGQEDQPAGRMGRGSLSGVASDSAELPKAQGPPEALRPRRAQEVAACGGKVILLANRRRPRLLSLAPNGSPLTPGSQPGFQWQRLMAKAQERRKWSARGQALNYAKNGMPKNLDGPARGFGKHLGRWGWREMASRW